MKFYYRTSVLIAIIGISLAWLIPSVKASAFVPDRTYYEKRGDIVWEVPTTFKIIALTFDDGPDPEYTPEILDILKKNQAKATFFLIGQHMEEYPEIVKREVEEGHEIENHTFSHIVLQQMTNESFMNDINRADQLIQKYQPSSVKMFRPPGGGLNLNETVIDSLRKEHFEIVLWTWHQDTEDWKRPGVGRIVNTVTKNAKNGDIIILHDAGGDRSQTVAALKQFIPQLKARGYQFVTVKELLSTCPKYQFLFKDENQLSPNWPVQN